MRLSTTTFSRRTFLGTSAAVGAGVGVEALLAGPAGAAERFPFAPVAPPASRFGSAAATTATAAKPLLASLITTDPHLHLGRRATYGLTPELHRSIATLGATTWVERQLDPATIDDSACDGYLERFPLLGLGPAQLDATLPVGSFDQMDQMSAAYVVRATWSERQLYEMMVEFWWNHFNIGLPNSDLWNLCGSFDNVLRANALGRFSVLLRAVAESPAMLVRLNQNLSVGTNPNENYAREMLELHTVGVAAGYSQLDVHNASLLLTGWGLDASGTSFAFDPSSHYVGPLTVMGFTTANTSTATAPAAIRGYLRYLAHHPDTATHLATKLATRFVSDDPPASLVKRLAATYLANNTEIAPVLLALLTSPEFNASVGQKVRRPVEAVAASLRTLGYTLANDETGDIEDVTFALEIMGQAPLGWPQPNGYPDTAPAWTSASFLQALWGTHMRLTGAWWTRTLTFAGLTSLLGDPPATMASGDLVDLLCERLLSQRVTEAHKAMLLDFIGRSATDPIGVEGLAGLPMLAKLVLDSPYFSVR